MGKLFNIRFDKNRIGIWKVTFWKVLLLLLLLFFRWWTCGFCAVDDLLHAQWDETEFIVFQHVMKFPEGPVYQW